MIESGHDPIQVKGWVIVAAPLWRPLGIGWFTELPWNRYAGHNIMIFDTRREARIALKEQRIARRYLLAKRARVVRA